jgi:hypothetical protein
MAAGGVTWAIWRARLGQSQHAVVKVETSGPRLVVARVPAIGFLQAGFKRCHLYLEHTRYFAHVFGDGRNIEIFPEIVGLFHGVSPGLGDDVTGHANQGRIHARGLGELLHQLRLRNRLRVANIERFAHRPGFVQSPHQGLHQVVHVNELHEPVAIAGDYHRAAGAQAIPKKLLAVVRVPAAVDEGGAKRDHRQSALRVHPEQ